MQKLLFKNQIACGTPYALLTDSHKKEMVRSSVGSGELCIHVSYRRHLIVYFSGTTSRSSLCLRHEGEGTEKNERK